MTKIEKVSATNILTEWEIPTTDENIKKVVELMRSSPVELKHWLAHNSGESK